MAVVVQRKRGPEFRGFSLTEGNISPTFRVICSMRMRVSGVVGLLVLLALGLAAPASTAQAGGTEATPAPQWVVSEWLNSDPGTLAENKGKVVLIDFLQLWCPGCRAFSIPLFQEWDEKYGARDDVLIVSIHTVFEGHSRQTPERLRTFIRDEGITHPVGVDAYLNEGDRRPITMQRYRTGGTPHIVIIDKAGRIRFSHFGSFRPEPVEAFIDELLAEDDGSGTPRN